MGNRLARDKMKEKNDRDNVPNCSSESLLSFQAFGEKTNVPIQIRRAVVDVVDPLPFIPHFMASLELTVMNNFVKKDLAGKFRITLPVLATVKKFEILRHEASAPPKWYPAVAVPKKKAKEVVYKEKEKGRDVAALADVASGSNMFEIEVAPLPFEVEVKCRMECMISGESGDIRELVDAYFPNDETEVILNAGEDTKMSKECRIAESGQVGGSAIGKAFGKTHFICHIPPVHNMGSGLAADNDEYCGINPIKSIAILWDASFSMSKHSSLNQKRFKLLRELANECNKHVESPVRFELYTFCVGAAVKKGAFGSVDELISTIEAIDYDGGTDVDTLSALLLQLSRHQHVDDSTEKGSCAIDCALIFTDGMDSLSKTPHFEGMHSVSFPVHVVADTDTVNLRCACALTAASAQRPGCIFSQKDESYLPGVLYKQAILKSIKTDQSEDAFLEEVDDGFRCVPDHRLQHLNEPIGSDGFTISGVLGEKDECTVSKVVATVAVGGELHDYCFLLGADSDTTKQDEHKGGTREHNAIHSHKAVHLGVANKTDDSSSEQSNPARILGHLYAEAVYRAAEAFGFKSGTDMEGVREELSVEYGFCSPESSLLMLYTVEQFLENDVLPPKDHPVYDDERFIQERQKHEKERESHNGSDDKSAAVGEIGGLKNDGQKEQVVRLASELDKYFNQSVSEDHLRKKRRELGEGTVPFSADIGSAGRSASRSSLASRARGSAGNLVRLTSALPPCDEDLARDEIAMTYGALGGFGAGILMAEGAVSPSPVYSSTSPAYSPSSPAYSPTSPAYSPMSQACFPPTPAPAPGGLFGSTPAPAPAPGGFLGEPAAAAAGSPASQAGCMELGMGACDYEEEAGAVGGGLGDEAEDMWEEEEEESPMVVSGMPMSMTDGDVDGSTIRRDQSSVAPPQDPKDYAEKIEHELKSNSQGNDWKKVYQLEKAKLREDVSPSFFLACARLALKYGKNLDAIRIATNCLELGIEDVQLLRCTAYFLLSSKHSDGTALAIRVFERVKELQPCEPQSFLDLAMAIFWKSTSSGSGVASGADASMLAKSISTVQKLIAHVLTHRWADRFLEIEWAALVLLHFVADFVKETNQLPSCQKEDIPQWPSSELASCFQQKETDPLRCSKFDLALMVWLGWDTDHTDIDLHVIEPTQNEVYYSNRNSTVGGHLSRDFTQGYGPEVYLLKDWKENSRAQAGKYDVHAKYYASHQDSVLTGTTSALLWTMEKNREKGGYEMGFETVRLDTHKEKTKIKTLQL